MALVTEDGTGKADAESYITLADANARMSSLGMTIWAPLLDSEKEQALRRATAYMEQAYRERWIGCRLHSTQALSWPRWNVMVDGYPVRTDIVPPTIANACADLALKAAAGDLNADLTRGVVREKVGPLETEYDRYSPQSTQYRAIDMALVPFLKGSGANARLVRA